MHNNIALSHQYNTSYFIPWWHRDITGLCEGNVPVTSGFRSQWTSDVELWSFLYCLPERTVEQTDNLPITADATTLMWHHCNTLTIPTYCLAHFQGLIIHVSHDNNVLRHRRPDTMCRRHQPATWDQRRTADVGVVVSQRSLPRPFPWRYKRVHLFVRCGPIIT